MKKYTVTDHAIQRATERLGIMAEHATNHIVQLMQTAFYNGDTPSKHGGMAKVYDHYKTRTRIIVGEDSKIVTVYRMPATTSDIPQAFSNDIRQLVKRKFAKAQREHKRIARTLEIELAELNLQIAQLRLNVAKARSPKVRATIQAKMNEIQSLFNVKEIELSSENESFSQIKSGTEALL